MIKNTNKPQCDKSDLKQQKHLFDEYSAQVLAHVLVQVWMVTSVVFSVSQQWTSSDYYALRFSFSFTIILKHVRLRLEWI